jgi:DNA-binding CsgD family transcriptional regulator
MITLLEIVIFVLSLAVTSGGILISSHLRTTYKTDFMSSLLFFQVFWFTFGFYVPWGQIIIASILETVVEPENLEKVTGITLFLGSPFLVFAWLMFLKLTREVSNRKSGIFLIVLFLAFNFICIPGILYLLNRMSGIKASVLVQYTIIITGILYTMAGAFFLISGKKKQSRLNLPDTRLMAFWLLLLIILQQGFFFLSERSDYLRLAYILLFYCFGGFLPLFFRYRADLSRQLIPAENNLSFDRLCEKYEISKREKEIIHEICEGLTNQQIADKLFISLQTVKDHTHRIYGKTNCSSRAQLMRLVNENMLP